MNRYGNRITFRLLQVAPLTKGTEKQTSRQNKGKQLQRQLR